MLKYFYELEIGCLLRPFLEFQVYSTYAKQKKERNQTMYTNKIPSYTFTTTHFQNHYNRYNQALS